MKNFENFIKNICIYKKFIVSLHEISIREPETPKFNSKRTKFQKIC